MARFTLLEFHFEDAEFTANAPFSDEDEETMSELEDELEREESETSGGSMVGVVFGLLAAVGVLYAARRALSHRGSELGEGETEAPLAAD